jgi:hypothetical protein
MEVEATSSNAVAISRGESPTEAEQISTATAGVEKSRLFVF